MKAARKDLMNFRLEKYSKDETNRKKLIKYVMCCANIHIQAIIFQEVKKSGTDYPENL